MFRAGGCSSQVTRCIHLGKSPADQASSLSPPNAVKVQSSVTGWNKQPLMQELTKALKSVSSDLLDRFIDSVYKFSEQPYLNEVNIKIVNVCMCYYIICKHDIVQHQICEVDEQLFFSISFVVSNLSDSSIWHNFHLSLLQGNFGPVNEIGDEVFIDDLNGEVPKDFPEGVYIRNGPNPLNASQTAAESIFGPTSYMYYEGHGMLHAIYLSKSNLGEWRISYKNKYVDTDTFELERKKNKIAFLPSAEGEPCATLVAFLLNTVRFGKPVKDSANTSIFQHAGRAFAATENHLPYEIDINNLRTLGPYNINGAWDQPFTSHPKKICGSGELVTMGTNIEKPHYVLGVISSDGERLLHKVDLKFEEGKLIHDIGVTAQYNIIMDYPLHFGLIRTILRKPFIQNDMGGISRIGVMPRFGDADSIIWFDVENHCSYHLFNCFEDGNEVVIRGCRTLDSVLSSASHDDDKSKCSGRAFLQPDKNSEGFDPSVDGTLFSRPYEWRLNLKSGTTKEGYLTDEKVAMDFPVINEDFVGVKNNYGYAQVVDSVATSEIGLFKYNRIAKVHFDRQDKENKQLKSVEYHVLKEKTFCSGVQFVAKENGIDEDDGWIITYVHDELTNVSQVYIIDAKRFAEEPVLKITLPQRVPYGFHGNFFYK
nr:carotenoid 9,10(9',10')-cleavage dioxygenase 1 isoform X3 [Oryza sativa Japonica Group]